MTYFLSDTWHQIVRHVRTDIRIPIWLFVNIIQPILWLLLFTQIFKSTMEAQGVDYIQHFSPAVVVMTVMFGSVWSGMGLLMDIEMGVLSKMLATPVSRVSIIMARVVGSMVMLIIQALIIFGIALALGLSINTGVPGVIYTLLLITLLGFGFAGLSCGLALLFRRQETLIATLNFVSMPVMFLTSSFVPSYLLPRWLDIVRQINPVEYAILGVRGVVNDGWIWSDQWKSIVALGLWMILGIAFGTLMFRKRGEN
ncbi:ABC transporter permease [Chloroflexota bacterium]